MLPPTFAIFDKVVKLTAASIEKSETLPVRKDFIFLKKFRRVQSKNKVVTTTVHIVQISVKPNNSIAVLY
jgi:hypothetical protein